MCKVTLFEYADEGIHITITARFENEDLIVEGYDIGKTVEEAWGDSDYEYTTTIRQPNMKAFCKALEVKPNNKDEILKKLSETFTGNTCYSDIGKFLSKHHIESEGFTWT